MKPATPLPWRLMPMNRGTHLNGITNMLDHDDPLAHVECHQENKAKRERDAAYIVAACNAYPELVAALRSADAAIHAAWPRCTDETVRNQLVGQRHLIGNLLAKLGEQ